MERWRNHVLGRMRAADWVSDRLVGREYATSRCRGLILHIGQFHLEKTFLPMASEDLLIRSSLTTHPTLYVLSPLHRPKDTLNYLANKIDWLLPRLSARVWPFPRGAFWSRLLLFSVSVVFLQFSSPVRRVRQKKGKKSPMGRAKRESSGVQSLNGPHCQKVDCLINLAPGGASRDG